MSSEKRRLALLLVALLASCGLTGCPRSSGSGAGRPAAVVRVTHPILREVTDYAYFTGRTSAVQSVDVQARVTGYLQSVDFVSGADVKAGARLFKIDPRPYQAVLDEANGQVQLAEARLGLAKADYERALEVSKTPGAISKQDIDRYAAAQSEAAAAVTAAKANSESAKLNLDFTDVLSPIDGEVGRNLLTIGNLVKQDTTLLTTVVSEDPIYAYFDVDERTMLRVQRLLREGALSAVAKSDMGPVQLGLADDGDRYPHEGRLDFVNNAVDASTATIQARGEFPNPAAGARGTRLLTPGLFVRIRLPIGPPHQALVVPQSAIGTDQDRKYVLVVGAENNVEYRPVTTGPEQPEEMQIVYPVKMVRDEEGTLRVAHEGEKKTVESLTATDRVIVGGLQRVRPGVTVQVRDESTATSGDDRRGPSHK